MTTCPNYGYYCYFDKADGIHRRLNASDIIRWLNSIKKRDATLDRPSDRFRAALIRRDSAGTGKGGSQVTNNGSAAGPVQGSAINTHVNINLSEALQHALGVKSTPKHHYGSSFNPVSSPLEFDEDSKTEFEEYFDYIRNKCQNDLETIDDLNEAEKLLREERFDLKGIKELDLHELAEILGEKKRGLARLIRRNVKEFKKDAAAQTGL